MGGCFGTPISSYQNSESDENSSEGVFQLNIGRNLARTLHQKFGDQNMNLPRDFQSVIEIPESLGRELYEAFIESLSNELVEEDEDFMRQLHGEGSRRGETSRTRGQRIADLAKLAPFPQPATYYRNEAQKYLKSANRFCELAKISLQQNDKNLADRHLRQYQELTKLYQDASDFAAAAVLAENSEKHKCKSTLDLHHLYVREAVPALDVFLDDAICNLRNKNVNSKELTVITGRGKHSANGIPKIKPAVIKRLGERGLRFSESNPGLLNVYVYKDSLTDDSKLRY